MKVIKTLLIAFVCIISAHTADAHGSEVHSTSTNREILTFTMPYDDTIIEKIEHGLLSWTMKSSVAQNFSSEYTSLVFTLVSKDGNVTPIVMSDNLKIVRQSSRVANVQFQTLLENYAHTLPSGEYKIVASLRYDYAKKCARENRGGCTTVSSADAALIALAARYGSHSDWFTINLSGTEGGATTVAGVQNPAAPVITRISPPKAGKDTTVTIRGIRLNGTSNIEFFPMSGRTPVRSITPLSVSTTSVTFSTNAAIGAGVRYGESKIGIVTNKCAGGCDSNRLMFTLNRATSTTSTTSTPTVVPTTTDISLELPYITVTANGTRVFDGGRIQAPGGTVTLVWSTTGVPSPVCRLNGSRVSSNGSNVFTSLTPASYEYKCGNLLGTTTLEFSVEVPVVTGTTTVATRPTITLSANGKRVTHGEVVPTYNGEVTVEWGGVGATSCTLNDEPVRPSGSQTFTGIYNGSYTYTCTNSSGSRTISFTTVRSTTETETGGTAITEKPSITIKANGTRVRNGKRIDAPTGVVLFEWGSTGANRCTLNGVPFDVSGSQTYTGFSTTDYSYACANSVGTTTINFTVVVPAVLGAADRYACTALPYNLHRGHESVNVKTLQEFLRSYGLLDEVTGFYGDKTVAAVKAYQLQKGLPQTGMVFEFTRAALRADSCQ
jgi:hypothetical protein